MRPRLPYVHGLTLLLLSELSMLDVKRGSYRHPPAHRSHPGSLGRVHLGHGHTHLPCRHVLIHGLLGHQGLPRLLLMLQLLEPLLLHLLLQCRVIGGGIWEQQLARGVEPLRDGGEGPTHLVHLGMMKHLSLCWIQVLHGMGVQSALLHASHEGGSIHLRARARHSHVADELVRHASLSRAGLTRVVGHARGHRMARRGTWMLLHGAGMRRKAWRHTGHHLQSGRLSTRWITTCDPPRYRMRS